MHDNNNINNPDNSDKSVNNNNKNNNNNNNIHSNNNNDNNKDNNDNGVNKVLNNDIIDNNIDKTLKTLEETIIIFGAFGGRFDQQAANLNSLYIWKHNFDRIILIDQHSLTFLLRANKINKIKLLREHNIEGPTCGLIPLANKVNKIKTSGLEWNLNDESLEIGFFFYFIYFFFYYFFFCGIVFFRFYKKLYFFYLIFFIFNIFFNVKYFFLKMLYSLKSSECQYIS
jgi:thiamine pyrophosphokinase